jgi:hypothetical protein
VITLSYGLGFGMVLVLILVPALLVMGHDMGRAATALRRMLRLPMRGRARGVGLLGLALGSAVVLWGFATLGFALITGAPLAPLATLIPEGVPAAFAAFLAGTAALLLTVWIAAGIVLGRRTRPAS